MVLSWPRSWLCRSLLRQRRMHARLGCCIGRKQTGDVSWLDREENARKEERKGKEREKGKRKQRVNKREIQDKVLCSLTIFRKWCHISLVRFPRGLNYENEPNRVASRAGVVRVSALRAGETALREMTRCALKLMRIEYEMRIAYYELGIGSR